MPRFPKLSRIVETLKRIKKHVPNEAQQMMKLGKSAKQKGVKLAKESRGKGTKIMQEGVSVGKAKMKEGRRVGESMAAENMSRVKGGVRGVLGEVAPQVGFVKQAGEEARGAKRARE